VSKPAGQRLWVSLSIGAWVAILGLSLAVPALTHSPALGEHLTHNTVRLAVLYWCATCTLLLLRRADQLARWCWTLGLLAFLVHLAMAFHYYHNWSHAEAVAHTEQVSGFGWGILFSHLFTMLWTAETCVWWLAPNWRRARAPWIEYALHGYMVFIILNGTVVYEQGLIRWAGVVMFSFLIGVFGLRNLVKRR
jgi:hypothetical protein